MQKGEGVRGLLGIGGPWKTQCEQELEADFMEKNV